MYSELSYTTIKKTSAAACIPRAIAVMRIAGLGSLHVFVKALNRNQKNLITRKRNKNEIKMKNTIKNEKNEKKVLFYVNELKHKKN